MIDSRFSADAFEACGLNTTEAGNLAELLSKEIQLQLHYAIMPELQLIIDKLNSFGHRLKPDDDQIVGDISFRDDNNDHNRYQCKLRIGIDLVVSTGYAHLISPDDV